MKDLNRAGPMRASRLTLAIALAITGLVVGTGAQRGQGAPPSPTDASGAVSGVVTDAETHHPVAGVNVQLGPPPQPGSTRLGNMFTDANGRFVFTSVPAGNYFINAIKAGYADGHYGVGVNGALGGNILLAAGQWFDAANVTLTKLVTISGHVYDEHGEPAVGAYVRAITTVTLGGATHLVAASLATTNDLGEYRISKLRAGRYFVAVPSVQQSVPVSATVAEIEGLPADRLAARDAQAARQGGPPARRNGGELADGATSLILGNYLTPPAPVNGRAMAYPTTFYPGTPTFSTAVAVDVPNGGERNGIDITLSPAPAVRVSGRLQGNAHDYTGVILRLVQSGLEELGEGSEAATAVAQADGSFAFLDVPAGSYTLSGPGSAFELTWRPPSLGGRDPALPETPGTSGGRTLGGLISLPVGLAYNARTVAPADPQAGFVRTHIDVGSTDLKSLAVPVQPSGSVHGDIVVEDVTGRPPTGPFDLTPANGNLGLGAYSPSNYNTPAAFDVAGVLPGDYALRFNGTATIKSVMVDGEDRTRRPVTVRPGGTTTIAIVLTGKLIKLSGVVHDAKGAPVVGGCAVLFPTDRDLWTNAGFVPTWIRPSTGNSNGTYSITNIRAGEYYVVGVDPSQMGAWNDPAFLEAAVPAATRITLDWGDAKTLDLTAMVKR